MKVLNYITHLNQIILTFLLRYLNHKTHQGTLVLKLMFIICGCFTVISSRTIDSKTCFQIGAPERNVTLMYGMDNPNVQRSLIGHVKSLKECVEIACRRENASLAFTSRFDCYAVTCHGDEELCWLLPSFNNPTLVFARLERKKSDNLQRSKGKAVSR